MRRRGGTMWKQPGTNQAIDQGAIVEQLGSFGRNAVSAHGEAARRNGLRSRGPKTPGGKAIAAKNAIQHGLRAASPVLPTEDPAAWEAHRAGIVASLKPRTHLEEWLAARIALETWRLDRAARMERAATSMRMNLDVARREAGDERKHILGSLVSRALGGEGYRHCIEQGIEDLEARAGRYLQPSRDVGESVVLDATDRELIVCAWEIKPEELDIAVFSEGGAEACRFLGRVAQIMAARGVVAGAGLILRHASKVASASAGDMRAALIAFDQDVALCLERKALLSADRLDLLLRYEGAASRNFSRLLAEYRSLRSESDPLEGEATEKSSPARLVPLRAVEERA